MFVLAGSKGDSATSDGYTPAGACRTLEEKRLFSDQVGSCSFPRTGWNATLAYRKRVVVGSLSAAVFVSAASISMTIFSRLLSALPKENALETSSTTERRLQVVAH
ncbi:hypothetical protein ACFQX7_09005 [Luedemannella flava]